MTPSQNLAQVPEEADRLVARGMFAANQTSTMDMRAACTLWTGEDSYWFPTARGRSPVILSRTAVSQGFRFLGNLFLSQPGEGH